MAAHLRKQMGSDYAVALELISNWKQDFDPTREVKNNELSYITGVSKRLEDVPQQKAQDYFTWICVSIKLNNKDGLREYRNENERAVVDFADSEGELVSLNDLRVERKYHSAVDIAAWREKLPYLLKRLHDKSKQTRVHILSLLIAYTKAKRSLIYKKTSYKEPKPKDIVAEGVYKVYASGYVNKSGKYAASENPFASELQYWVKGIERYRDEYFDDAMELLDICDALGIDITKEDPTTYDEEYISSLVIQYIADNSTYMFRGRLLNRETLKALDDLRLDDYFMTGLEQGNKENQGKSQTQIAQDVIQKYKISSLHRDCYAETQVMMFQSIYNHALKKHLDLSKAVTRDGFYYEGRTKPLLIDISEFNTMERIPGNKAVLSSEGYLLLVNELVNLYYLDLNTVYDMLADYAKGETNERYARRTRFGTWQELQD